MEKLRSLEDFFLAGDPTVDGRLEDPWVSVPLIGREIEATVLVARPRFIENGARGLSAAETLGLLNRFFAGLAGGALGRGKGIVGDCGEGGLTALFSREFGSADPFGEALLVAREIGEDDVLGFAPRIGIAGGELVVGYLGAPLDYRCAALGSGVELARACADAGSRPGWPGSSAISITFPEWDWEGREFDDAFAPRRFIERNGSIAEDPFPWRLEAPEEIEAPGSPALTVRRVVAPVEPDGDPAEDRIRAAIGRIRRLTP
jgi:hypothetical protein